MKKFSALVFLMLLVVVSIAPTAAQDPVTIVWYIGLGAGAQPPQREGQEAVVAEFNATHDDIVLEINIVENTVAYDTLSTLIAAGNAPDIVGPVGNDGANGFGDAYLDIQPLVDETGYDLTQWPQASVDYYRDGDRLLGLPLGTFPSMIYYIPALFDEAGLNYPPANYGDPYVWPDGTEVEWTVDVLREVAILLTVDANGNDASSPDFDPENVIQWGFDFQWYGDGRQIPTMWGASRLWDPETGEAVLPDAWREGFQWWYDGMWVDYFIPIEAQRGSDLLAAGNTFSSGNIAMAQSHLWYTCCLEEMSNEWDMAPVPSYNGVTVARLHADTFRILASTEHPAEAFEVLTFLVGPAALDLLTVYGGMPARVEEQQAFFDALDEAYPQGVNWQVARDGLNYADAPSHEAWFPNYLRGRDRITQFSALLNSTPGLDVQAELETFIGDMQTIFDEAGME